MADEEAQQQQQEAGYVHREGACVVMLWDSLLSPAPLSVRV